MPETLNPLGILEELEITIEDSLNFSTEKKSSDFK